MTESVRLHSEKYGNVVVQLWYSEKRELWDWAIFFNMPVHLYDFVWYRPPGPYSTYRMGVKVDEGYHHEPEEGTHIHTRTNHHMRLDFEMPDDNVTLKRVDALLDIEFRDAVENYDGVIGLYKIVGTK
jgi:hypothetical protein